MAPKKNIILNLDEGMWAEVCPPLLILMSTPRAESNTQNAQDSQEAGKQKESNGSKIEEAKASGQ